jgi:hyperosmotically inducible periplasmic protein
MDKFHFNLAASTKINIHYLLPFVHPCVLHLESNWERCSAKYVEEEVMRKAIQTLFAFTLLLGAAAPYRAAAASREAMDRQNETVSQEKLTKEVRHELLMLPWYSVFYNLAYQVDGDKVTLYGQVTRPALKSDAETVVKKLDGGTQTVSNIEVLPLSPMDDQLRRSLYRSIYGYAGLSRYSIQPVPSIHIIVKNGNVTLEGVVDNEMDKNLANMRANQVPNVFSVKNNLAVDNVK